MTACAGALSGGRQWADRGRQLHNAVRRGTERSAAAAAALWRSEDVRRLLRTWYVRLLAAAALALGLATAVVNLWAVRSINANLLPQVSAAASRALDRDVSSRLCTDPWPHGAGKVSQQQWHIMRSHLHMLQVLVRHGSCGCPSSTGNTVESGA